MRCELHLTFSERVCAGTRLQALQRSLWDMAHLSQPWVIVQVPSALSCSEKAIKKRKKSRSQWAQRPGGGVIMSRSWWLRWWRVHVGVSRWNERHKGGMGRTEHWLTEYDLTFWWLTEVANNILSASHLLGSYCNKETGELKGKSTCDTDNVSSEKHTYPLKAKRNIKNECLTYYDNINILNTVWSRVEDA